jgi:hypothetical protein
MICIDMKMRVNNNLQTREYEEDEVRNQKKGERYSVAQGSEKKNFF